MTTAISTLIVDDEALARKGLRTLLRRHPDLPVVAEAGNGAEAVAAIRKHRPELVFLDVQMPSLDGFAVIEQIGVDRMPAVVFVTAHDRHALKAFDVHAVDYLLKPFDTPRFDRAVERVRERSAGAPAAREFRALLDTMREQRSYTERLLVQDRDRTLLVNVRDLIWIEAADNYVRLHLAGANYLLHDSIRSLEQRLDPATFLRVHRSAIVHLDRIREIQQWFGGGRMLILSDGSRVTVSRSHWNRIAALDRR
jgi:two-component system LytT family response regulator